MSQRLRRRLPVRILIALAALVTAMGVVPTGVSAETSSSLCDRRANATPSKLVECIKTDDLWNHMKAFQAIADANPGPDGMPSRNSGEPGYKGSVDYVASLMKQAGYSVTLQ